MCHPGIFMGRVLSLLLSLLLKNIRDQVITELRKYVKNHILHCSILKNSPTC